ncbi:MAG: YggT family protein [Deltaproteobacteria bacterium]|nr:YggT family protein [Deltaproteobacteria bacterium]
MFVIGNFLGALADVLAWVLSAYIWVIIGRAIISWVNADPYNPIVRFLYEITEPALSRIRRVVPIIGGGLDLSPMLLIMAIWLLQLFLIPTLHDLVRILNTP